MSLLAISPHAAVADSDTFVLGTTTNLGILPMIALRQGYFTDEGVKVDLRKLQNGKIVMDALLSHDIELGTMIDANMAFADFQSNPLRIIATLGPKYDEGIWFLTGSGIEKPEDLRGKTIGYLPATTSNLFLTRFLAAHGIDWSEIKPVIVQPPAMEAALRSGTVQAVSVWQPWEYDIHRDFGEKAKCFSNTVDISRSNMLLVTTDKFLHSQPETLHKILRALIRAEGFNNDHRDEADAILAPEIGATLDAMPEVMAGRQDHVGFDDQALPMIAKIGEWVLTTQEDYEGKALPDYAKSFSGEIVNQP